MLAYCRPVLATGQHVGHGGRSCETKSLKFVNGGDHSFLDTNLRKTETYVYHAMAINENRGISTSPSSRNICRLTRPTRRRPLADVEQRWFVGAHGDVGGGSYNDLLAQIPLRWLMTEASLHGLGFQDDILVDTGAAMASFEDSFATSSRAPINSGSGESGTIGRSSTRLSTDPCSSAAVMIRTTPRKV